MEFLIFLIKLINQEINQQNRMRSRLEEKTVCRKPLIIYIFQTFEIESLEQIFIIGLIPFSMDIESTVLPPNWKTIFSPLQSDSLSALKQTTQPLQSSFSTSKEASSASIYLTLVNDRILVSESSNISNSLLGEALLCFDLKFEVHHQIETDVNSNKIGFKLYIEDGNGCSFYAPSNITSEWINRLSKQIHQKGFHQRFKPLRKLGKGNFATVYEVERISDKKKFAVKAFSKQGCFSANKGKQSLVNQLSVMRTLSKNPHRNVLMLEGVFQSDNSIYVVLQLLAGGQLFHRIQQRNGLFTDAQVRQCMLSLISGLNMMHEKRYMHRDLKPENIMLRNSFSLDSVIVDFGLACHADEEKYLFHRCGTPGYVAPQIIALTQNGHVEPECDIFSVGVIFHILLTRKPIFQGFKYDEVYRKNKEMDFKLQGDKYDKLDSQALDLLKKMLVADPKQRITAKSALAHPYFEGANLNEDKVYSPVLTSCSIKLK